MPFARLAACAVLLMVANSNFAFAQSTEQPSGLVARRPAPEQNAVAPGNASEDEAVGAGKEAKKDAAGASAIGPDNGRDRLGKPQAPREPSDDPAVPPRVALPTAVILATIPGDERVEARDGGFAVLSRGNAGDRIVQLNPEGKGETVLFDCGAKVDRWWLSTDHNELAWIAGGRIYSAGSGAGAKADLGAAPAGDISFSSDNRRVAFVRDGHLVIAETDGRGETTFEPEAGLTLGDSVAYSNDLKTVYVLVSSAKGAAPDGIGSVAVSDNSKPVARLYQAAGASLRSLRPAPDGVSLAFVQTATGQKVDSLRLFTTQDGTLHTIARGASIDSPVFNAGGSFMYFSAKGANGRWQAWEVATLPNESTGEYTVRRVVEQEGKQFRGPVPTADGMGVWIIATDLTGAGAQVGTVKLK